MRREAQRAGCAGGIQSLFVLVHCSWYDTTHRITRALKSKINLVVRRSASAFVDCAKRLHPRTVVKLSSRCCATECVRVKANTLSVLCGYIGTKNSLEFRPKWTTVHRCSQLATGALRLIAWSLQTSHRNSKAAIDIIICSYCEVSK